QVAPLLPKGLAWRLTPGTDLVVEVHMKPSGKTEVVEPSIGLYFGDEPPERTPAMLRLGRQSIDIAAGQKDYAIGDSFVLPVDVEVQAIQPHAHYRAREVKGLATLPDGTTKWLIYIKDWDFRWQHVYRYVTPFVLPKGTTLEVQFNFGTALTFAGRLDEAIDQYQQALKIRPDYGIAHNNLGNVLLGRGNPGEALEHFREALRLDPSNAEAHYNVGSVLRSRGDLSEAAGQFREALQLKPDWIPAVASLAWLLATA